MLANLELRGTCSTPFDRSGICPRRLRTLGCGPPAVSGPGLVDPEV